MTELPWATQIFIDMCCSNCSCSENESAPIPVTDNMGRDISITQTRI